jgi:hypothetical protein
MTFLEFRKCVNFSTFPTDGNILLKALYHDAKGDWETAHDIAQSREGILLYDRLHAYLHRKEGDDWNANYWYNRVETIMPTVSLAEEWTQLLTLFLENQ